MIFSTKTTLSELLKEGFSGRAVPIANVVWHTSFLDSLVVELEERTSSMSGPQYRGEAEAHMLYPILEWATRMMSDAQYLPGTITKDAYSLSAIYSIIHRVMRVMNFKDAVDAITADAVQNTPIVAYIRSTTGDDGGDTPQREVWSKFWHALNDRGAGPVNDPVALMVQMMAGDYLRDDAETPTQAIFSRITRYLRMGKGVALLPSSYDTRLAQINQILQAVRRLQTLASISEDDASALTSDAFVLTLGLCAYLDSVAAYDTDWDSNPLPFTRDAQPNAIKEVAKRMAGHYLWISSMGISTDLQVAAYQWEQLYDFLKEALPESSAVSDLRHLWADKVRTPLEAICPSLAKELVNATAESFRSWTNASHVLRPDWLPQIVKAINDIRVASAEVPTPDQILQATHAQLDDDHKFRVLGRPGIVLPILQDYAASIANLVLGATSMIDIVTCQGTLQYSKDATTISTLPIHKPLGLLSSPSYETFDAPAPYESVIEALVPDPRPTYAENNIRVWRYREILFSPRMELPYKFSQLASGPQLYWPYDREACIGTPSSAMYYVQPLPDCYTRSRCTASLPFSFAGYEQAIRGVDRAIPTTLEYFETASTLIVRYPGEQGKCVIDALSQLFAITVEKTEGEVEVQYPRTAFLYGAPAMQVIDHNLALEAGWHITVSVDDGKGGTARVTYKAFAELPSPIITEQVLVKCGRLAAVGVQVPSSGIYGSGSSQAHFSTLLDTATSSAQVNDVQAYLTRRTVIRSEQVVSEKGITGLDMELEWVQVKGYSQFTVALGAYSCIGRDRTPTWQIVEGEEGAIKLAMASVSKKWKPLSQTYELGVFTEDPLLLVTPDDYYNFMATYSVTPPRHGRTTSQPKVEDRGFEQPQVPQDAIPAPHDFTSSGVGQNGSPTISGIQPSSDTRRVDLGKTEDTQTAIPTAQDTPLHEPDVTGDAVAAGDPGAERSATLSRPDPTPAPANAPDDVRPAEIGQHDQGYIVNDETKKAKKASSADQVPDGWRFVTALPDGYEIE